MVASLLTCSGASVGVSISTQRRMPSRMAFVSNGLEGAVLDMLLRTSKNSPCHFRSAPGMFKSDVGTSKIPELDPQLTLGLARNENCFIAGQDLRARRSARP